MLPGRDRSEPVVCIACGERLPRADAREYDKYGDRWNRDGKSFEYVCKPCYADLTKFDRRGLESLLVDVETAQQERSVAAFVAGYFEAVEGSGPSGHSGRAE